MVCRVDTFNNAFVIGDLYNAARVLILFVHRFCCDS